jgi:hypothetical protein
MNNNFLEYLMLLGINSHYPRVSLFIVSSLQHNTPLNQLINQLSHAMADGHLNHGPAESVLGLQHSLIALGVSSLVVIKD